MKYFFFLLFCTVFCLSAVAQYAPQQGIAGSTAISAADPSFTTWASGCALHRGYECIDSPALGYTTNGDSSNALGIPDFSTVSLGDSGVADLSFPSAMYDGPGADFAVFENGFANPANDSQAFLELAFVEVSSDGINYVRFPVHSLTQTATQIPGSGTYMYANLVDGLAGKYVGGYGTPFDLSDLPSSPLLDKSHVTHIRIIDVIGSVHGHTSLDADGHAINDPYPTNFFSGGFDLDAVGIINHVHVAAVADVTATFVNIYPNPATDLLFIDTKNNGPVTATLTALTGAVLQQIPLLQHSALDIKAYAPGMYYLILEQANGQKWTEKVIKR